MQIKELKKKLKLNSAIQVGVVSHASSGFYLVQIRDGDEVKCLTSWRGQQRVFRSLDEAINELKHHGITRAVLLNHVAKDEPVNRRSVFQEISSTELSLSF